jgi:hypothetical protein
MNQQDQRDRFQRAIKAAFPNVPWVTLSDGDFAVNHGLAKAGDYTHTGLRSAWEGFQLADNAALEVIAARDAEIAAIRTKVLTVARDAVGFRYREGIAGTWSYNYHRRPDEFEREHCEIQWLGVIQDEALLASQDCA